MPHLSLRTIIRLIAFVCLVSSAIVLLYLIINQTQVIQGIGEANTLAGTLVSAFATLISFIGYVKSTNQPIQVSTIITMQQGNGKPNSSENKCRERTLNYVESFWVKGMLQTSPNDLPNEIDISMIQKSSEIKNLFDGVITPPRRKDTPIKSIIDVYDNTGKEILVLGEPGSGKTTKLIEVAKELITRARQNEALPIPIVFNLSSWVVASKPFSEWLIDELKLRYRVPQNIGQKWVQEDGLTLLLDGLDEVAVEYRDKCVHAINIYHEQHAVDFVICSRTTDYHMLHSMLHVQTVIELQALSEKQIDDYLNRFNNRFMTVAMLLKSDKEFRRIIQSPLMLMVAMLAYENVSTQSLQKLSSHQDRTQQMFDMYVQQMFERRGTKKRYGDNQTKYWLSKLAQKTRRERGTGFFVATMGFGLLSDKDIWNLALFIDALHALVIGYIVGLYRDATSGVIAGIFLLVIGYLPLAVIFQFLRRSYRNYLDKLTFKDFQVFFTLSVPRLILIPAFFIISSIIFLYFLSFVIISTISRLLHLNHLFARGIVHTVLYLKGDIPWNYARFLDYCAERVFLRKVDQGYIFIHHYLLVYFASLEPKP